MILVAGPVAMSNEFKIHYLFKMRKQERGDNQLRINNEGNEWRKNGTDEIQIRLYMTNSSSLNFSIEATFLQLSRIARTVAVKA